MKVHIQGDTPLERLANFTRKVVAVPKREITALEKRPHIRKRKKKT